MNQENQPFSSFRNDSSIDSFRFVLFVFVKFSPRGGNAGSLSLMTESMDRGIQPCWARHQSPQLPFTNSINV